MTCFIRRRWNEPRSHPLQASRDTFGTPPVQVGTAAELRVAGLVARVLWGRPEGARAPRGHMLLRVEAGGAKTGSPMSASAGSRASVGDVGYPEMSMPVQKPLPSICMRRRSLIRAHARIQPYSEPVFDAVIDCHLSGKQALALTDSPESPLARNAVLTFLVDNTATGRFRPISGAIALVQTLVSGLAHVDQQV